MSPIMTCNSDQFDKEMMLHFNRKGIRYSLNMKAFKSSNVQKRNSEDLIHFGNQLVVYRLKPSSAHASKMIISALNHFIYIKEIDLYLYRKSRKSYCMDCFDSGEPPEVYFSHFRNSCEEKQHGKGTASVFTFAYVQTWTTLFSASLYQLVGKIRRDFFGEITNGLPETTNQQDYQAIQVFQGEEDNEGEMEEMEEVQLVKSHCFPRQSSPPRRIIPIKRKFRVANPLRIRVLKKCARAFHRQKALENTTKNNRNQPLNQLKKSMSSDNLNALTS